MEYSSGTPPVQRLIDEFSRLPGVGPKSAQRLTYHLIRMPAEQAENLASAILSVKTRITLCSKCFHITENDPCTICSDTTRDSRMICIVESSSDIMLFENTGFNGLFHVLGGLLSPLDGISPDDLAIKNLLNRLDNVEEIIIAIGTSIEGETTSLYLINLLKPLNITISRLSQGLPVGGQLEYIDEATLEKSFLE